MTSTPPLSSLEIVTNRLSAKNIVFALGGSGLLFALGIGDKVRDWDLTTEATSEEVIEAIKDLKWELILNSDIFKSDYLIKLNCENVVIEIIGNFRVKKTDGNLHSVPVKVSGYWNNIALADPYEWMLAYRYMGRDDKAQVLEKYLTA